MAFWNKNKKKKPDVSVGNNIPVIPVTPADPEIPPVKNVIPDYYDSYDMPAGIPISNVPRESGIKEPVNNTNDFFVYPPPHDQSAGGWVQTYALVFFLMENNVCTRKIDFTCYGYDRPDDILRRMQDEQLLPQRYGFAYRILYWPTRFGMSTVERFDTSEPKSLQEFNPEAGKVFIIEQYRHFEEESEPMYTLYGCPTAALPEQENILRSCCVDTVSFDGD